MDAVEKSVTATVIYGYLHAYMQLTDVG